MDGRALRVPPSCQRSLDAVENLEKWGGVGLVPNTAHAPRGGLAFKAHRLVYHSTLGLRVMKKKMHLAYPLVKLDALVRS